MMKVKPNEAFWAVQNMTELEGEYREKEAQRLLATLATMDDFIGGRILPPAGRGWWELKDPRPVWTVQTLHTDCGAENAGNLPEGLRRVLVLPSQFKAFGIQTDG